MKKQQVIHIHGGMSFSTYEDFLKILEKMDISFEHPQDQSRWSKNYYRYLDNEKFEVLAPVMPSKDNAKYSEWKIWFEKLFPYLDDNLILVGHSLGGTFLAKYLSENIFPKNISQLHLAAAVHSHDDEFEQMGSFQMNLPGDIFQNNIKDIYLYHSEDDLVVPIDELDKFSVYFPNAHVFRFTDRFHFLDETFPELFQNIRGI